MGTAQITRIGKSNFLQESFCFFQSLSHFFHGNIPLNSRTNQGCSKSSSTTPNLGPVRRPQLRAIDLRRRFKSCWWFRIMVVMPRFHKTTPAFKKNVRVSTLHIHLTYIVVHAKIMSLRLFQKGWYPTFIKIREVWGYDDRSWDLFMCCWCKTIWHPHDDISIWELSQSMISKRPHIYPATAGFSDNRFFSPFNLAVARAEMQFTIFKHHKMVRYVAYILFFWKKTMFSRSTCKQT